MSFEIDPLAYYGRNIIQDYHESLRAKLPLESESDRSHSFDVSDDQVCLLSETKVGILGAGIGGLYAALILDSLDIDYEILEASDRIGGRIFTYKFSGGGKYDYYDAGAMRFPLPKKDSQGRYKNGVMKRLAELTEYEPLNQGQNRLKDHLIPFHFEARSGSKSGFYYYNGIREPVSNTPKGALGAQDMGVDEDYIRAGADAIIGDATRPFIRMIVEDIETGKRKGWEVLKANDSHTMRSYLATKYLPSSHLGLPPQHLPNNVISWCGLLGGHGGCDAPLVELLLVFLSFSKIGDIDYTDTQWKCFEGGSETLPKKIEEYLNKKGNFVQFHKRVTAMSQGHTVVDVSRSASDHNLKPTGVEEALDDWVDLAVDKDEITDEPSRPGTDRKTAIPSVAVTVNGNDTLHYAHVISTLPYSVLRTIDLSGASLNTMQKNAMRTLGYVPTTKLAVLFKSNWWSTKLGIVGGQTFTDLPICMIIYPSHGIDSGTPSKVLIAGFAWAADAICLGSLAITTHREVLLDLVLRNLAEVHSDLHPDVTCKYLKDQFVDMHVQDWARVEHAMGAAASFGPGEFHNTYTSLTYPAANKRLHFAGEAVSTHHGWVVGALDASWRAIYGYLKTTSQDEKMKRFKDLWGENSEWVSRSPSVETAQENNGPNLLDEHLGLVDRAIREKIIPQCH